MKGFVWLGFVAGLMGPAVCVAQLASPQWRQPGVDSTHVIGTAAKVMPDYPVVDHGNQVEPPSSPRAPTTIAEMLAAFEGVVLSMPGNDQQGPHGQIRLEIGAAKAQLRFTISWQWHDGCALTAQNPMCIHGVYRFTLSPEGVFAARNGCGQDLGSAGGSAEFKWIDFVALSGLTGADKSWRLQRDSFWSTCYPDTGSSG